MNGVVFTKINKTVTSVAWSHWVIMTRLPLFITICHYKHHINGHATGHTFSCYLLHNFTSQQQQEQQLPQDNNKGRKPLLAHSSSSIII